MFKFIYLVQLYLLLHELYFRILMPIQLAVLMYQWGVLITCIWFLCNYPVQISTSLNNFDQTSCNQLEKQSFDLTLGYAIHLLANIFCIQYSSFHINSTMLLYVALQVRSSTLVRKSSIPSFEIRRNEIYHSPEQIGHLLLYLAVVFFSVHNFLLTRK